MAVADADADAEPPALRRSAVRPLIHLPVGQLTLLPQVDGRQEELMSVERHREVRLMIKLEMPAPAV